MRSERSRRNSGDQPLAPAVAVGVGGVDEAHAGVDGGMERRHRGLVVDGPPVGADRPPPEADRADLEAGLAESPSFHGLTLSTPRLGLAAERAGTFTSC